MHCGAGLEPKREGQWAFTEMEDFAPAGSDKASSTTMVHASRRCSKTCKRRCCCAFLTLITVLSILGFGVALPLVNARAHLCDINITSPIGLSQLDIHMDFGVHISSIADVLVPVADASVVTGIRTKEAIPIESDVTSTVAYGALAACAIRDAHIVAQQVSPVHIHCALSQYESAQTTIAEILNAFIDGAQPPMLSVRYRARVVLLGVSISLDDVLPVNVSSIAPPRPPSPPPVPRDEVPPLLQPPLAPPPPATTPSPQLCSTEAKTFDPASLLSGASAVGLPGNYAEALTLVRLCDMLLCQGSEWSSGVDQGTSERSPLLADAPSQLPVESSSPDACSAAVSERAAQKQVVAFRVTFAVYNTLGLGARATRFSLAFARKPSGVGSGANMGGNGGVDEAPTITAYANTTVSAGGAVIACALNEPVNLPGNAWTSLAFDCAASTASFPGVMATYESGAEFFVAGSYDVDAAAAAFAFKRKGILPHLKIARSSVRSVTRLGADGHAGIPRAGTSASPNYGPGTEPTSISSCGSVGGAQSIAEGASAAVNSTFAALRVLLVEARLV